MLFDRIMWSLHERITSKEQSMREYEPAGSGQGGKTVVSERNDGGPAFPGGVNQVYTNIDQGEPTQPGMSLRQYPDSNVSIGKYGEVFRHGGRTEQIQ